MVCTNIRAGIDIGGTFTDVVLEVDNQVFSNKTLTTHTAPEDAIIAGIDKACAAAMIHPADIQQIIHGTTLATNALIERRGAKTALITTKGFRDILEMRTESRFEQYDLNLILPSPLITRQHRYVVEERIGAQGDILLPLDKSILPNLIRNIELASYESVAVGLLHSYANPAHEIAIGKAIAQILPNVMVSLSSQVSPQMREYERFSTVAANAYIKPLIKRYLHRLKKRLLCYNVACDIFLIHSGGGIISLENAAEFPVRLVESGPAGGAVFAANIATCFAIDRAISFDMGGTTAKICLIKDQTSKTSRVFEVARSYRFKKGSGIPLSIPTIDMVEIGAGGGSLARVDSLRQIRIGPESAGSEPGPACYGRGGQQATVTDADLVLGRLIANDFADNSLHLNKQAATTALENLGKSLNIDAATAAYGVCEVVDENMANAARVHAIENGVDLAQYSMIAFGGAAPLHAGRLCQKLAIKRLLIPSWAGVGSAVGFLRAPFSYEASHSLYMKLSQFSPDIIYNLLQRLQTEAVQVLRRCNAKAEIEKTVTAYMRYCGQGWEIPVILPFLHGLKPDVQQILQLFKQKYTAFFGRTVNGLDIEITGWALKATIPLPKPQQIVPPSQINTVAFQSPHVMFDSTLHAYVKAAIIPRRQLNSGQIVRGPAIIIESETTVILSSVQRALCHSDGTLDITTVE